MPVDAEKVAGLLHAMNSPVRLAMLVALDDGPLVRAKLYRRAGVPAAVGRVHLQVLVTVGAVRDDGERVEAVSSDWGDFVAFLDDLARRNGL